VATATLARWTTRGDRLDCAPATFEGALEPYFDWPGHSLSVAALSRQSDCGDATGSAWLRADPAHVRADMATARMLACGELGLDPAECAEIARDLKPLFGDAGFEFDAPRSERWYLRAPPGSQLPQCASPDQAMGDDLKLHLPEGASGKRWRQLFNDAQVILHNHPVNARRAARGAVSVNSLWFWGAGVLPDFARSPLAGVLSNRPEVRALARLAGLSAQPLEGGAWHEAIGAAASAPAMLLDLLELRDGALQDDWLAPAEAALAGGRINQVVLEFASGERFRVRQSHRWRFWRTVRGLQA
jgi:hypothetical protein